MKRGELSNQVGYTIGFQCVDFLIKYKDENVGDKILNKIFGKVKRAEIDENVLRVMNYLYRHTDYTVDLIVEGINYTPDLKRMLEDEAPFNRIVIVDKPSQITQRLITGDLTYFIDDNAYRRSLVNNVNALSLNEFRSVARL